MLKKLSASLLVLSLVVLTTPLFARADTATGTYKFIMEDAMMKYLEFDVKSDERGGTSGYMIFTDEAKVMFQDVDGNGDPLDEPGPFSMKAEFDSMTVEKNRAIISGVVRDSSHRSYIGKWIQLVIEDNDGREVPDRFVWSLCQPDMGGWIPQDAEVPGDKGAFMSWWATDAERRDDVGMQSPNIIPGSLKSCVAHPLKSYEWAPVLKGDGIITITQQ
jgi:hypothetical protein